jgi:hypothetical protein
MGEERGREREKKEAYGIVNDPLDGDEDPERGHGDGGLRLEEGRIR